MTKTTITRARLARGISIAAVAAALAVAQPALAQTTAAVRGHVEGASPGTVVTATDTNTGQRVTGRVNEQGDYVILGLRPSTYKVAIEGQPEQTVQLPVGQTITADFGTAEAAGGGKDVVVTGRRRQEVRTAEVATNVSQAQIENLPQNDRNFLNFAALAPGIVVSPSSGSRQVQAGAISADNINVFIDGLSLKNPINHGGVAGQNFSKGNPFPQLAVQEFKVDTQNFKAEYEQAGSAIITAVTKTGGEEFHGDAFGEWQPKAFLGRPYFDRPGKANNLDGSKKKPPYDRKQYGADIGGPIIKDKLHFFLAYEATDQKLPSSAVSLDTSTRNGIPGVPASLAQQYNGSYAQSFKQDLYFGKLTFFASDADTINLSSFLRRESNLSDFGGTSIPEHGRLLTSKIDLYQLEWNHRTDSFLNEFTLAYNTIVNGTVRNTDGPEIILTRGPDTGSQLAQFGAADSRQNDRQKTWTLKDNITFFGGAHIIKAGYRFTFNKYERLEDLNSNGTYFFEAGTYTGFDTSTPYSAKITTVPVQAAKAKNNQIGLFIQDDWTPDEHWTVNAGLRWDYETNAKNENFVTPARIVNALRNYPNWAAAGINANDYISTGDNRHPYWKAFQPRLGVSYDVNGDRDTIFFAGAGRYYDRPLFITAGIETTKAYYQSVSRLDATPGNPIPKDVDALRAAAIADGRGGDVWLLNNNTKLPYTDQFNIGFRKRLGEIQTSITFSYQRSENIFKYVRGNRYVTGDYSRFVTKDENGCITSVVYGGGDQWINDSFPGNECLAGRGTLPGGQLPGFNGKLNIGSNDGKATYTAIYFTAEKPFTNSARWGFTSTLTIGRARSNVAQELQGDEFYNGPRIGAYGQNYVNGTEKFRFVGTGLVRGPWNTVLSGTLTLASGPAFGNIIFLPNPPENACCYGNLGGVFFPHTTFGYKNLDLRVAKKFVLPWGNGGHTLEASFAAFNVFDWVNRNYTSWGAGGGINPPYKLDSDGTVGNARSFQAGLKYSF